MNAVFAIACGMTAVLISVLMLLPEDAHAQTSNSASYKCENRYDTYRNLGEVKFIEKYRNTSIGDCLKLYKNPNWHFSGKSKIDRYYEQKAALEKAKTNQPKADILWNKVAGNGKYAVSYKICANNQHITQPTVLASSRVEEFLAVSYNSIPSNACKTFQTTIKSHSSSDIAIKYVPNIKEMPKSLKIVNLEKR